MSGISKIFKSGQAFAFTAKLVAFSIPVLKIGIQFPILLLIIAWAFSPKKILKEVFWPILVFSGIYLFHLIAMTYSTNVDLGLVDLEQKLSLLLFPIIMGTVVPMKRKDYRQTMGAFVIGTIVAVIIGFVSSWLLFQSTGDPKAFYMSDFSPVHHPSYLAMYMNMAIFILVYNTYKRQLKKRTELLYWVGALFLSLSLVFPASKMGLLMFIILVVSLVFVAARMQKLFSHQSLYLVLLSLFFVFFYTKDPVAKARMDRAISVTTADQDSENPEAPKPLSQTESSTARLIVWGITIDEIKANPLGVGTGDVGDHLKEKYLESGYDQIAEKGLNPHNTYLELALEVGILGLIWFVFSLLYPTRMILIDRNWIYGFFILNISLNFLVESMLEGQSGVVFFAFFNAVFFFHSKLVRGRK